MTDVKKSTTRTPSELEAEIAASAQAIGEAKTVKPKSAGTPAKPSTPQPVTDTPSTSTKIAVTTQEPAAPKKPAVVGHKQAAVLVGQPDGTSASVKYSAKTIVPVLHEVTEKPSSELAEAETAKQSGSAESSTTVERESSTPTVEGASVTATVVEPTVKETSTPARFESSAVADDGGATATATPSLPSQEAPAHSDDTAEPSGDTTGAQTQMSDVADTSHKLDSMTDELKAKSAKSKPADSPDQHTAKIYDTKQYHVPIRANKHHRKALLPLWGQIVLLVFAVTVAFVGSAWLGVIDIDLPFIQ